jgi:hypothetical protein
VIKTNAKQRYASDAIGTFVVKQLIEKKGGKVQEFEVRNDMYVDWSNQRYISGRLTPSCVVGPVVQQLGLCSPKLACALLTLEMRCFRCIPSARPQALMTSRTQLTSSQRFLRASRSSTRSSRWIEYKMGHGCVASVQSEHCE